MYMIYNHIPFFSNNYWNAKLLNNKLSALVTG